MTDRAYIVSRTLETKIAMAQNNGNNTLIVTLDVLKEILALLKEPEAVVRCKDCKHYEPNRLFECRLHGSCQPNPDWFCADGERKEK